MKQKANEADQESDLRDAFKIFDRDNNGYIDMKELKQVWIKSIKFSFTEVNQASGLSSLANLIALLVLLSNEDKFTLMSPPSWLQIVEWHILYLKHYLFVRQFYS